MSWIITGTQKVGDPHWDNVSLLLHGDGTNGSTTIVDSSPTPKTVTAYGDAQISTAQSKFGGSSIAFDGTGDYLVVSSQLLNSSVWTVEAWVRPTSVSASHTLFSQYNASNANRSIFWIVSGKISIFNGDQGSNDGSVTLSADTWYHIAFVRNGTTVTGYIDGVQDVQKTNFIGPTALNTYIGAYSISGTPNTFAGNMDEIRVTLGVARYTSNFTPPTAPFPDPVP